MTNPTHHGRVSEEDVVGNLFEQTKALFEAILKLK